MLSKLQKEIIELKDKKNAIILAHNYQRKEIQEIADFLGDSLELCIKASEIKDKDILVFCGVDFMAETAYILNPDKKILIPDRDADCPMANMLSKSEIEEAKEKYPNAAVVLYVNSTADAKAESDLLVTSGNVKKIINVLDEDTVLFGPDANLAKYTEDFTDKKLIPIPGDGHCYVHKMFTVDDIESAREKYPNAQILVHPETNKEVQLAADYVLSTGGIMTHIKESSHDEFVLGTEIDIISRLELEVPDKTYYPLREDAICETMKYHTLEKLKACLEEESPEIVLSDELVEKCKKPVNRMLEASK